MTEPNIDLGADAGQRLRDEYRKVIRIEVIKQVSELQPEVLNHENSEQIINTLTEQALAEAIKGVNVRLKYKGGSENYK